MAASFAVGDLVVAARRPGSPLVPAVVVAVDGVSGVPAIARLARGGGIRQERLWTGLWFRVEHRPE